MQAKNAARVLPEPVGAEMRVVCPARMCGQPCSCGSVGVEKRVVNHSCTSGWAQAREGETADGMRKIVTSNYGFVKRSPLVRIGTIHHHVAQCAAYDCALTRCFLN